MAKHNITYNIISTISTYIINLSDNVKFMTLRA